MEDPQHSPVTVTILDTKTGETRTDPRFSPWYWTYGNGSCDCNRQLVFEPDAEQPECGESRYYIVGVEGDAAGYEQEEWNAGFPPLVK